MDEFFISERFHLKPKSVPYFREELFVSAPDARTVGLSAGQYCILSIDPLFPGPPAQEFAVHVAVDSGMEPGAIFANQNFLDAVGFRPEEERFWSIRRAPSLVPVREAVFEVMVEQGHMDSEIQSLRHQKQELFSKRCLLIEPGRPLAELSLPMLNRGYFNLRSIQPSSQDIRSRSILVFDDNTTLNLFVPHRRSGVDMVIVVDASGSMDLCDYVATDGRARTRIEGVRNAMDVLLQRRLASGSRVSKVAAVLFGNNTRMLYPLHETKMIELRDTSSLAGMRDSIKHLSQIGLERLQVDRSHTNISGALRYAAELLDYYAQEGNEKMLVLLSDGADWAEDTAGASDGEIISTVHDPAVLADSLHFDSQVRIHTVSISDKEALRRYEDPKYSSERWAIPNTELLRKIADITEGLFIESPDARSLAKLFDDLGEGALYPI